MSAVGICGLANSDTNKYTNSYVTHSDTERGALRTREPGIVSKNRELPLIIL